jgi:hypothetical protein
MSPGLFDFDSFIDENIKRVLDENTPPKIPAGDGIILDNTTAHQLRKQLNLQHQTTAAEWYLLQAVADVDKWFSNLKLFEVLQPENIYGSCSVNTEATKLLVGDILPKEFFAVENDSFVCQENLFKTAYEYVVAGLLKLKNLFLMLLDFLGLRSTKHLNKKQSTYAKSANLGTFDIRKEANRMTAHMNKFKKRWEKYAKAAYSRHFNTSTHQAFNQAIFTQIMTPDIVLKLTKEQLRVMSGDQAARLLAKLPIPYYHIVESPSRKNNFVTPAAVSVTNVLYNMQADMSAFNMENIYKGEIPFIIRDVNHNGYVGHLGVDVSEVDGNIQFTPNKLYDQMYTYAQMLAYNKLPDVGGWHDLDGRDITDLAPGIYARVTATATTYDECVTAAVKLLPKLVDAAIAKADAAIASPDTINKDSGNTVLQELVHVKNYIIAMYMVFRKTQEAYYYFTDNCIEPLFEVMRCCLTLDELKNP